MDWNVYRVVAFAVVSLLESCVVEPIARVLLVFSSLDVAGAAMHTDACTVQPVPSITP